LVQRQQSAERKGRLPCKLTLLHMSQVWTATPFFALLTRPVMGVSLMGSSLACGWGGIGLMGLLDGYRGRPPIDDDEAADPYPGWSIDSMLVVL
jgi:hypothetical protein